MRGQVTDQAVARLDPEGADRFLWDEGLPGFGAKVTATGRRSFIFQFRMGGRDTPTARITIGPAASPWTAELARVEAGRLRDQVAAGVDPRRRDTPEPAAIEGPALPAADWRIHLGLVITDIARLQRTAMRRTVSALGGSHEQSRFLGELSLKPGISQAELARSLNLSKVAVNGLTARAVRAGWIEQQDDPADRRTRRLYLTPTARRAVAAMRTEVDAMNARLYAGVGRAEAEAAIAVLMRLRQGWTNEAREEESTAVLDG